MDSYPKATKAGTIKQCLSLPGHVVVHLSQLLQQILEEQPGYLSYELP